MEHDLQRLEELSSIRDAMRQISQEASGVHPKELYAGVYLCLHLTPSTPASTSDEDKGKKAKEYR
jgi:hypothetical protein